MKSIKPTHFHIMNSIWPSQNESLMNPGRFMQFNNLKLKAGVDD